MSSTHEGTNRRRFLQYLGVGAASAVIGASGTLAFDNRGQAAHATAVESPEVAGNGKGINVLLVHGALADTSTWSHVAPALQQQGYHVLAVQLPLNSVAEDSAITQQALATLSGPTIVVGHSYGGFIITQAARGATNVIGLVYLAAFAPTEDENINTIFGHYPATLLLQHVGPSYRKGYVWCDPAWFPQAFAQDLNPSLARALAVGQKPIDPTTFGTPSGVPAWKSIPSWYLVSSNDHCIDPRSERDMAKRIGATTHEVASSHLSPLSHPQDVLALIAEAARKK